MEEDVDPYNRKQYERIERAKMEAMRFIERADTAMNAISGDHEGYGVGREIGAVKRSSMDLTRALVFVRKAPHD